MFKELHFPVEQQLIRLTAQEPTTALHSRDGRHPAIILLHGSGGHLDFWVSRFGPLLEQAGIGLYAPHYFERTGTLRADLGTIQDGVHVPQWLATVDQAVRFVGQLSRVDPERIVLAGVSLGAFLALALAATLSAADEPAEQRRLRAVMDISGGLVPPYEARATDRFPPTLILHGAEDPIVPASYATALREKLTALNVAHRAEILPGEGHWFSPAALPRLLMAVSGFLEEHLKPASTTRYVL